MATNLKKKKPEQPEKRIPTFEETIQGKVKMQIGEKTWVWVKPGTSKEDLQKRYSDSRTFKCEIL